MFGAVFLFNKSLKIYYFWYFMIKFLKIGELHYEKSPSIDTRIIITSRWLR